MADEGGGRHESSNRRMDLNLYLGLPRAPLPRRPDLGSDLALSIPPPMLSSAFSADTATPPPEPETEPHPPYSPSRAAFAPPAPPSAAVDVDVPGAVASAASPEYTSYYPAYEGYDGGQNHDTVHPASPPLADDPPYSPPYVAATPPPYPPPSLPPPLPPPSSFASSPTIPEVADELGFSFHSPSRLRASELLGFEDGPSSSASSRLEFFRPEARIRRLLEASGRHWRLPARRFRSSYPHVGEASDFVSAPVPASNTEQLVHEAPLPQELVEDVQDKADAEGAAIAASEEGSDERGKNAANFECNICFDMATEPVVTSCGHLFCWSCLYQWLHVHSDHKECPVCKGEVTEANITPIYGRGSSNSDAEKKSVEDGESGHKIPPRPRGNRLESFRQQFRPISRRLGEGLMSSWRRILDQQIMSSGSRLDGPPESVMRDIIDTTERSRAATRTRIRSLQREAQNAADAGSVTTESGLPGSSTSNPPGSSTSSMFRDGFDFWRRFSLYGFTSPERLAAAISADLRRMAGPVGISNHYGASASSSNPPNPEPPINGPHVATALAADQASASSTMAVIQGDAAISDGPREATDAGSSRSLRRRGRSSTSDSLDVDGGGLHSRRLELEIGVNLLYLPQPSLQLFCSML